MISTFNKFRILRVNIVFKLNTQINLKVIGFVFFLSGTTLVERMPELDPIDGLDFDERTIAENVSDFRVERLAPGPNDRAVLIDITLQLSTASGETVDLTTRVRVGSGG